MRVSAPPLPIPPPRAWSAIGHLVGGVSMAVILGGVVATCFWLGRDELGFFIAIGLLGLQGLLGCTSSALLQRREAAGLRAIAEGDKDPLRERRLLVARTLRHLIFQAELRTERFDVKSLLDGLRAQLVAGSERADRCASVASALGVFGTAIGVWLAVSDLLVTAGSGALDAGLATGASPLELIFGDSGPLQTLATAFSSSAAGFGTAIALSLVGSATRHSADRLVLATSGVAETLRADLERGEGDR